MDTNGFSPIFNDVSFRINPPSVIWVPHKEPVNAPELSDTAEVIPKLLQKFWTKLFFMLRLPLRFSGRVPKP